MAGRRSCGERAVSYMCDECGRSIIAFTPQAMDLCGACLTMPGWFRYPDVRKAIDPAHDGLEVGERIAAERGIPWPVGD